MATLGEAGFFAACLVLGAVALGWIVTRVVVPQWRVNRHFVVAECLVTVDPANYRNRHFQSVCETAGIGRRKPRDLRDTFASQLLTAGVQLGYVSQQRSNLGTPTSR